MSGLWRNRCASGIDPGRREEVWRVVCACGQSLQQWSVTQGAAIRAWNRNLAQSGDSFDSHQMGGRR